MPIYRVYVSGSIWRDFITVATDSEPSAIALAEELLDIRPSDTVTIRCEKIADDVELLN